MVNCLFRSNDVTLANKMESTGKPGTVHISEKTYSFLKDDYFVQEGSPVGGKKFKKDQNHFLNSFLNHLSQALYPSKYAFVKKIKTIYYCKLLSFCH